ncbi:MAG: tellurium resistance protein TerC [Rickettsiales bacterium]|nr:tellurium resistance protein TerC [Rickettsiales bacterium]|tara:strand:+ start:446 stop:1216 length:771 start_codon:yes stop_codon:yes gene_type:complete
MLIFLQAVLGFDNLLYVSIESGRVEPQHQQKVRRLGIGGAIVLRIILLFVVVAAISSFQQPFAALHLEGLLEFEMNLHAAIVLAGGIFILYTAVKEISHMLTIDELGSDASAARRSVGSAIVWIAVMNLVFSFDSILSAVALTDSVLIMAISIVVSGILMIVLADHVAEFLKKNRMYEVLGLFILLIVGVMLISEGGHLAHLWLGGHQVTAMAKSTFYFVIIILVAIDLAQSRYQKKLNLERKRDLATPPASASEA